MVRIQFSLRPIKYIISNVSVKFGEKAKNENKTKQQYKHATTKAPLQQAATRNQIIIQVYDIANCDSFTLEK